MSKGIVIPDVQAKPGINFDYLGRVGQYCASQKPDWISVLGDWNDFPSLGSYDVGKKSFEGRCYTDDVEAGFMSYQAFMGPILAEQERQRRNKEKIWRPELHFFEGNHENRQQRVIENDRKLDGLITKRDLPFYYHSEHGWKCYPFLEVGLIDGIAFSHYFTSGVMGRPVSSSRALVNKKHMSCVMGHVQNWEMHREVKADGTPIIGLFAGSCYEHDEDYLGPQGNHYWRGIWVFHECDGSGDFQPMPVSLKYLEKRYGTN